MIKLASFLLCAALACGYSVAAEKSAAKPNVVLFLVDDMGWMDCGAYGSKYYETPNMDRFATRAMRFTDAYAMPLCSPTRASILSGQYSARHGVLTASGHQPPQPPGHRFLAEKAAPNRAFIFPESKNYLDPSQFTLAEALREAGWRTGHFGKWHLGLTAPHWPEQQGFDVAFHCHPDPGPPGGYFSPYGVQPTGEPKGRTRVGTITDGPPGEYIVDRLTEEAIQFMEANRERPFFLNLWQYGVHGPWGHKEEYTRQFLGKKDPRGAQGNPIMASMLRSVDESFGRILAALDRLALTEKTLVIFYSDNGGNTHSNTPNDRKTGAKEEGGKSDNLKDWRKWAGDLPPTNNAPLRDGKGTLYEGGVRVPLMVAWPGVVAPGTTSGAVVHAIDLYPTLLAALGIAPHPEQKIDGISILPVLRGAAATLPREALFTFFPGRNGVTARAGDWKLLRWFDALPAESRELYNLRDDLGETKNLAEKMPDKVRELDALIDGFLKDTGALVPIPNPAFEASTPAKGKKKSADPLQGWVPKNCKATIVDGALRVEAEGRNPFIAFARLDQTGPATLRLQTRTSSGGPGRVQWRTAGQEQFPADGQTVSFVLPASGEWRDTSVEMPVSGQLIHLRLYLPAEKAPVEIRAAALVASGADSAREWKFSAGK